MKRRFFLVCLVCSVQDAAAQNLVLTNARILDGKGGAIERGSIVVRERIDGISGGRG